MSRVRPTLLLAVCLLLPAQEPGPSFFAGPATPVGEGASSLRTGALLGLGYQVPVLERWTLRGEVSALLRHQKAVQPGLKEEHCNAFQGSGLLVWESPDQGGLRWRTLLGAGVSWGRQETTHPIGLVPPSGGSVGAATLHEHTQTLEVRVRGLGQAGVGVVLRSGGRDLGLDLRLLHRGGPEAASNTATLLFSVAW